MVKKKSIKKAARTAEPIIEDDDTERDAAGELNDFAAQIAGDLGDGPDDANWKIDVYRRVGADKKGAKQIWIGDFQPGEVPDLKRILRDDKGGGDFRVVVRREGQIHRQFYLSIETQAAAPVSLLPAADGGSVADAIARGFEAMLARLDAARPDPLDQLEKLSGVLSNLGGTEKGSAGDAAMVDVLLRGMELGRKQGGTGGEVSMLGEIASIITSPSVSELLNAMTERLRGAPPAAPGAPARTLAAPGPGGMTPAPAPAPSNGTQSSVINTFNYLLSKAKAGSDARFYAAWLDDNTPPDTVRQLATTENLFAQVKAMVPEAAGYESWFGELIAELKAIIAEQDAEGRSDADAGNPANAS